MSLHGRNAEKRALASLVDDARASRSGVLVLRGQAGVGKSALLDDLAADAADLRILRAWGAGSESRFPFAGLHQLLLPVLDRLDRLPEHQSRALRVVLGMEQGTGADRFLVALAALGVLAEAAEDSPVACLIDDGHWLDTASIEVLVFVARRLHAERIALVFAVRTGEDSDSFGFPAGQLPELPITGLDGEAAAQLLREAAGIQPDPAVCARLVGDTRGNPLALLELASVLTADQVAGREPVPTRLPLTDSLEKVFAARAERLPAPTRLALLVAAAEETGRLATVIDAAKELGAPADALDSAERAGLIQIREGELRFLHPLVRAAIYQAAPSGDRRRAHHVLAGVFGHRGDPDRRAWHLAEAAVEPDDAVVRELDEAAVRAQSRGGFEAASAALERAADLVSAPGARGLRLVRAAENAWVAGQFGRVAGLLRQARPLATDPLLRADIGQLRAWGELSVGSESTGRQLLVDAATEAAPIDKRRARRMLAACAEASWLASDRDTGAVLGRVAAGLGPAEDAVDRYFAACWPGLWTFSTVT